MNPKAKVTRNDYSFQGHKSSFSRSSLLWGQAIGNAYQKFCDRPDGITDEKFNKGMREANKIWVSRDGLLTAFLVHLCYRLVK